jgi:putative SOS response-associated peptidase YedK
LVKIFGVQPAFEWRPRFNIAPTQPVAGVRRGSSGREAALLHWGLIPSWSKDPAIGSRMINARAETLSSKPSFRKRRCLILADGFYEWQKTGGRSKQPYLIRLRDSRPFAFAGLWESWSGGDTVVESCTIITTEPNALLAEIHDRMPVILHEQDYDRWLDPAIQDGGELESLLVAYPAEQMAYDPVSTLVNNPRNDAPACAEPLES